MKLIIAEKPSMGRQIANAVGALESHDGYKEGGGYCVSWCVGHVYVMRPLDAYPPFQKTNEDGHKMSWQESLKSLPFMPDDFQYAPKPDCEKQIRVLRSLLERSDLEEVIAAGDADREGEVIVRRVIENNLSRRTVPVTRLWVSALTPQAIQEGLAVRKPDTDYAPLYQSGVTRAECDWLIGMELTRLISCKSGQLFRVGRVIVPIVTEIANREKQIRDFKPETYYVVKGTWITPDGEMLSVTVPDHFKTKEDAEKCRLNIQKETFTVTSLTQQDKIIPAPKLFALSDLQGKAGKSIGLSPAETLAAVQSLYESGYVSYPRTNSNFLTVSESGTVASVLRALGSDVTLNICGEKAGDKFVYDDRKVESHSALIPTGKKPHVDGTQKQVYDLILNRFLAVFCTEPAIAHETKVVITGSAGTEFKLTGDVKTNTGWFRFEAPENKETALPPLRQGQVIPFSWESLEAKTKPPAHYTVATFNRWCKTPFKNPELDNGSLSDEDIASILKDATIGTEATRAGILDKCIRDPKTAYLTLKKNKYGCTEKGFELVEWIHKLQIDLSPQTTMRLQENLFEISKNNTSGNAVRKSAYRIVTQAFDNASGMPNQMRKSNLKDTKAKCPWCGKPLQLSATKYGDRYGCECGFTVFTKNRFFEACGFHPTQRQMEELFNTGAVTLDGKSQKSGKSFTAVLHLKAHNPNDKYAEFELGNAPGRSRGRARK